MKKLIDIYLAKKLAGKPIVKSMQGFTLIEIMIALVLGLVLMSGLIQILINSNNAFRMQSELERVQETGQFAMAYLAQDIRNADYWGCLIGPTNVVNDLANTSGYYNFSAGLAGTANQATGGSIVAGTDTITVSGAQTSAGTNEVLMPYPVATTSPIVTTSSSNFAAGTIVLVSDCLAGDIFQVTNANASTGSLSHATGIGSPGNASSTVSKIYSAGAFVYLPYTHMYSIQTDPNSIPSLFLTTASGSQELLSNVENMLILYGVDTDGNGAANIYVRANQVNNMTNVVSVRLNLVVRSADNNVLTSPQSYILNGQTVTPTDNRLRRVYTQTLSLRNRMQ
ncbi:MAG: prepilin-type N-terminal cleavage/methylation domain-containing protein [Legionellales bacterium]|nr:prepilin-type N-terminal cleavage/methylation domain-containing protein [Legionellales bacterium]